MTSKATSHREREGVRKPGENSVSIINDFVEVKKY